MDSSKQLFQKPNYSLGNQIWSEDFLQVAKNSAGLMCGPAAFLHCLTYGFVCGDHTLFRKIRRQFRLSGVEEEGSVSLESVPKDAFLQQNTKQVADELRKIWRDHSFLSAFRRVAKQMLETDTRNRGEE